MPDSAEEISDLAASRYSEGLLLKGVVMVDEHQVVEDHHSKFIAELIKLVLLWGHGAGDAHHVEPGRNERTKCGAQLGLGAVQANGVKWHPARASAENPHTLYRYRELTFAPLDIEISKPYGTQLEKVLMRSVLDPERDEIPRRCAM